MGSRLNVVLVAKYTCSPTFCANRLIYLCTQLCKAGDFNFWREIVQLYLRSTCCRREYTKKEELDSPRKDVNRSSLASDNTAILDNVDSCDITNFAHPVDTELLTDVMDVNFGADEGSLSINNNPRRMETIHRRSPLKDKIRANVPETFKQPTSKWLLM